MAQVFTYLSNDDRLTHAAIGEVRRTLALDPRDRAGFGVGWLQDNRTLLRQVPRVPKMPDDALGVVADLPTRAVVAHVMPPSDSRAHPDLLQPFRYHKWLFAARDPQRALDPIAETLIDPLPDFLARQMRGRSGAEAMFFSFLHALYDRDLFYNPAQDTTATARVLAGHLTRLERELEHPLDGLDLVCLTERCLFARAAKPNLYTRTWTGIAEHEEPLFAGHNPTPREHPRFRAVALASASRAPDPSWSPVPGDSLTWCGPDWTLQHATRIDLLT